MASIDMEVGYVDRNGWSLPLNKLCSPRSLLFKYSQPFVVLVRNGLMLVGRRRSPQPGDPYSAVWFSRSLLRIAYLICKRHISLRSTVTGWLFSSLALHSLRRSTRNRAYNIPSSGGLSGGPTQPDETNPLQLKM